MLIKYKRIRKKLNSSEFNLKCKNQILIFLHIDFNIKSIENSNLIFKKYDYLLAPV